VADEVHKREKNPSGRILDKDGLALGLGLMGKFRRQQRALAFPYLMPHHSFMLTGPCITEPTFADGLTQAERTAVLEYLKTF
jgi:hypothetical protein